MVGSGTLITFPVLLALGYAPVTANVSNTIGLVPGSVVGRDRLPARARGAARPRAIRLGRVLRARRRDRRRRCCSSCRRRRSRRSCRSSSRSRSCSSSLQPRAAAALAARARAPPDARGRADPLAVFGTGVYGGYFGAAQGILLLGILGVALPDDLQRVNALKNVLAGLVNLVAGIVFVFVADVAWDVAALLAVGATAGGVLGARFGRRLPPAVLRAVIVVVGIVAIARLL